MSEIVCLREQCQIARQVVKLVSAGGPMFQPLLALFCVPVLSLAALAQASGTSCPSSPVVIENIDANNHLQPWMVDETLPIQLAAYSKTWSVIIARLQHDFRDTTVPLAHRRKLLFPNIDHVELALPEYEQSVVIETKNRFNANPSQFIGELLNEKKDVVVTWGFRPDCERSVFLVQQLRSAGFKWIWFDGNRPAALREFQKRAAAQGRAAAQEIDFYRQMYRIENSRIVERLKPTVINSFDDCGQFKPTKELLAEIRASLSRGP